jgi:hypothetical protein
MDLCSSGRDEFHTLRFLDTNIPSTPSPATQRNSIRQQVRVRIRVTAHCCPIDTVNEGVHEGAGVARAVDDLGVNRTIPTESG